MIYAPLPFLSREIVLALPPSHLAGHVLQRLAHQYGIKHFNRRNVLLDYAAMGMDIGQAVAEAFAWLERECLIAHPCEYAESDIFVLSRAGLAASENDAFDRFRKASTFPRGILHPRIADKAWSLFLTGELDTAIFAAFKEVEIAVATKSGLEGTGVALMRAAFHKHTGPLRDSTVADAEREGMASLFSGAFGTFRNPAGHRSVSYSGPDEAAELLVMASHLMRIVDLRGRMTVTAGK